MRSPLVSYLAELVRPARDGARLARHRARWLQLNRHNFTVAGTLFPVEKVRVGVYSYGRLNLYFYGNPGESISIGSYCSIADNVRLLAGGEHLLDRPSTYPVDWYLAGSRDLGSVSNGPIVICDDVWLGLGCTILSGVTIGQGAVIGAGAVVANNVPPYAVYAAGRVIRYRFDDVTASRLLRLDWGSVTQDDAVALQALLTSSLTESFFHSALYKEHLREEEQGIS